MATLEESNILDAETINLRYVVYPLLAVAIIAVAGLSYYYYQISQREQLESTARAALVDAKAPADFVKVADQYPGADQATLALISAGEASFNSRDFASAITDYQRVVDNAAANTELRASAKLGLASAQEANGKVDDAIATYLEVAREGAKSPYAPYAYNTVALIYDQRGDKDNERKILGEAVSLDPDSPFIKQAQAKLKDLTVPPITVPVPASATAPAPIAPAATVTPAPAPAPK